MERFRNNRVLLGHFLWFEIFFSSFFTLGTPTRKDRSFQNQTKSRDQSGSRLKFSENKKKLRFFDFFSIFEFLVAALVDLDFFRGLHFS